VSEWREVPIGELIAEFHDGPHATPKPSDDGPVFLGIKNITEAGSLDLSSVRHISRADFPRWTKRATPRAGDIVFTYEATLHRYALIPEGFDGCLGRRLALIRTRPDRTDPRFLHQALRSPAWRKTVEERVIAGATVDRIPLVNFPSFPIRIPRLPTQQRIAAVLGAFDDLIVINERRIGLLEDFARSIYREWFVRFRFPTHTTSTEIPPHWTSRRVGDLAVVVNDGVDPTEVPIDAPYCGLEHLPRRSTTLVDWGTAESVVSRKLRFRTGDTLFGKIRPYFHKVVWSPFDGVASTDAIVFRTAESANLPALLATILSSDAVVGQAVATSNGTRMPRADPKAILDYTVALPSLDDPLIRRAEEILRSAYEAAAGFVRQNRALARSRDLLLPRLVTGRLDISDLDLGDLLREEPGL
jgi:type I restriction enzyme, S subunit